MMVTDEQVKAAALVVFTKTVGRAEEYIKAKGQKQRKDFDRLIKSALEAAEAAGWRDKADQPEGRVRVLAGRYEPFGEWVDGVAHTPLPYPFTHWRPLPAPPIPMEDV